MLQQTSNLNPNSIRAQATPGLSNRVSKRCDHATARSHKIFQRSRKIWVFERKNAQFTTVLPFWVTFQKNMLLFVPFCLRKTFEQKYWSRKTNCF